MGDYELPLGKAEVIMEGTRVSLLGFLCLCIFQNDEMRSYLFNFLESHLIIPGGYNRF